jgi:hypothetical protein
MPRPIIKLWTSHRRRKQLESRSAALHTLSNEIYYAAALHNCKAAFAFYLKFDHLNNPTLPVFPNPRLCRVRKTADVRLCLQGDC